MAAIALLALIPATECLVAPRRPRLGASAPSGGDARYYLGIDLSTQSCTAIVVDAALDVAHRASVNFDASFPAYGTSNGMHATDDGVATSPVAMWLDGLDAVLELIPASLRQQVDGVSFSGQQHGSVYWSAAAAARLAGGAAPRDERPPADRYTKRARGRPIPAGLPGGFREALAPEAFAVADAPIWADASTQDQCDARGRPGRAGRRRRDGSRAYARFTGHQMAALAARDPGAWQRTARVSLVSSFGPSLLRGAYVAVDASDSRGTNAGAAARREKIKTDFLGPAATWADFDAALGRSPPGNGGVLGLELALPEITPVLPTPGRHFADGAGRRANLGDGAAPEALAARAVVEGRFLSMRGRGARLGVKTAGGRATYAAFLASCGAGAGALDVVARPKHAHVYDDALVARYLKLEDDVRAGRL
ncbi:xylulokinase [Aureococcus anophagefferens]|nr:xylulokinase [Aureococcus anophagefferens]